MVDTEATLRPIGTVLSLVCQQYRVVAPNCNCRTLRSAGVSTGHTQNALSGVVYTPSRLILIGNSNTGTGNSGKSVFTIDCARGAASAGRVADVRPIDPYIVKKRRSSRFQRGIAHRQQTSFTVTVTPGLHRNGWQNSTFTHIPVQYQY